MKDNREDDDGKGTFTFSKGTLNFEVWTDRDQLTKKQKVNDAKVLSGGERSYATLSLLLALGQVIDNPFRAMDEFDIFMYVYRLHSLLL